MLHGSSGSGDFDREYPLLVPSKTELRLNVPMLVALGVAAALWFVIGAAIRWYLFR